MRIVAAVCWYDEQPEMLERCVWSLEDVVDGLIALDGGWEPYPDAAAFSPDEQRNRILGAAFESRLWALVPQNLAVYKSQIVKRAMLMELAREYGDWVLVIDADERVIGCDRSDLRRFLAHTACDVATVTSSDVGGHPRPITRLYRALPDLTVRDWHAGYYAGGRMLDDVAACDCSRALELVHETNLRTRERTKAQEAYLRARAEAGEL